MTNPIYRLVACDMANTPVVRTLVRRNSWNEFVVATDILKLMATGKREWYRVGTYYTEDRDDAIDTAHCEHSDASKKWHRRATLHGVGA